MGYVPPPPPPPARIPHWESESPRRRRRRNRIEDVPGDLTTRVAVRMDVRALDAHGERWEWRTYLTFDGCTSLLGYRSFSWRRPSPFEIRGRTRDEGKAWDAAREAADDARARHAAQQIRLRRQHSEQVPL